MANAKVSDLDPATSITDNTLLLVTSTGTEGFKSNNVTAKQVSEYVQTDLQFVSLSESANYSNTNTVMIQLGNYVWQAYKQDVTIGNTIQPNAAKAMIPLVYTVQAASKKTYVVTIVAQNFTFSDNLTATAEKDDEAGYFDVLQVLKIDSTTAQVTFQINIERPYNLSGTETIGYSFVVKDVTNSIQCSIVAASQNVVSAITFDTTTINNTTGLLTVKPKFSGATYSISSCVFDVKIKDTDGNDLNCSVVAAKDSFGQVTCTRYYSRFNDNFFYIKLKQNYTGSAIITFSDSITGLTSSVTVNLSYSSYTG